MKGKSPMKHTKLVAIPALAAASAVALAGCVPNAPEGGAAAQKIAVTATDTDCKVETAETTAGTITFTIKNEGSKVNEFYLLGENGLSIASEVENIAPGASRDLTYVADPGTYFTACKPGMVGADVGRPNSLLPVRCRHCRLTSSRPPMTP